jgi:hypothetical protein
VANEMTDLHLMLGTKGSRGSKARCHFLTHGPDIDVAARLTSLVKPFATIEAHDKWMPLGFEDTREAQLHSAAHLVDPDIGRELLAWWLGPTRSSGTTPNIDIASTCTVGGRPGLVLIEAKAHESELESAGKPLKPDASDASKAAHDAIGSAIGLARIGLSGAMPGEWGISRDSHYQLSNRFAWSWKLTTHGVPVVLVYLGFLNADEMEDRGVPLRTPAAWDKLVRTHGRGIIPEEIWDRSSSISGVEFVPLIRSVERPLAPWPSLERLRGYETGTHFGTGGRSRARAASGVASRDTS